MSRAATYAEASPVVNTSGLVSVTVVANDIRPIGGMERQLARLIQGLLERNHDVTVIARRCEIAKHPHLRWIRVPGPSRPFVLAYPWFILVASLLLLKFRRGIVHGNGAIVLNRVDICTVHLCHRGFQAKTRGAGVRRVSRATLLHRINSIVAARMARIAEWWCFRPSRVRLLVGVSRGLAFELGEFFPRVSGKLRLIPLGVDGDQFRPSEEARRSIRRQLGISSDALLAIFVGSEWEGKGLTIAIQAVAESPGWHLLVVGTGDRDRYQSRARTAGAEERIHFVGKQTKVADYYAASDAFLLPSVYETFSLVTYEAAASRLPLVATRVSGVEDVLVDGYNGWFIDRDREAIKSCLESLGRDPILRRLMGSRSRNRIQEFSWSRMVDAYVQLYQELS